MQFVAGITIGVAGVVAVPRLITWWKTLTPLPKISRDLSESLEYQQGELCSISIQLDPFWDDSKSRSEMAAELRENGIDWNRENGWKKNIVTGSALPDGIERISKLCYVVYIAPAPRNCHN